MKCFMKKFLLIILFPLLAKAQGNIQEVMFMLPLNTNTTKNILKADFVNPLKGCFLLRQGGCLVTQNGMLSATLSNPSGDTSTVYSDIAAVPGNWVVASRSGSIYYSSDAGVSWTNVYTNNSMEFLACDVKAGEIVAVGKNGCAVYGIGSSGNFSFTDNSIDTMLHTDLTSVRFGTNQALAASSSGLTLSFNFTSQIINTFLLSPNESITGMRIQSTGKGFLVTNTGKIFMTQDEGNSWNLRASFPGEKWNAIDFGDSLVIAVGDSGSIAASLDSGATFSLYTVGITNDLLGARYRSGRGYITGSSGTGQAFSVTDSTLGFKKIQTSFNCIQCIVPNPAADAVQLTNPFGSEKFRCILFDLSGREVWNYETRETISRAELPLVAGGTYLAVFTSGNKIYNQRLVVLR